MTEERKFTIRDGISANHPDALVSLLKKWRISLKTSTSMTIPLPNTTSEWSQGHLDVLNIHQKFLVKPEPSDFISMSYMKGIIMPTQKALEYVYWKSNDLLVQEITRCMSMALDNITLNFESVDDIPIEVPDELKNGLRVWKKDFLKTLQTQKLRTDQVDMIETFCWQVEHFGGKFADQLKYILINRRNENETSEGKYQQLFLYYLMMFNFNVSGMPNIDSQTVEIGGTTISSTPDFLVMEAKDSLEVLVVGKVKGRKLHDQSSPVRATSRQKRVRHVSEDLIGQHGGELLSHIHLSLFDEKGIFGMIVQATQVSLTSLFPESGYIENLKRTNREYKEATLNISKECNILTKAGRKSLLKPLLDLYFLQMYERIERERGEIR